MAMPTAPPSILQNPIYTNVRTFFGDARTPREVLMQRQMSADAFRFLGTPVLLKHRYTIEDVENGVAVDMTDYIYKQSTNWGDVLSHGVGYVSNEVQEGEWIGVAPDGDPTSPELIVSERQPYPNFVPAPRYRGYGPGFLTYGIFSDRPEDQWKLTEQGALIRQQTSMIQLPWWPQIGDNDLCIVVSLAPNGQIEETYERYVLMQTAPITLHGMDQGGQREFDANAGGNRYWIGQTAELTKQPVNDIIYAVETDR